jgi:hypothetical protein
MIGPLMGDLAKIIVLLLGGAVVLMIAAAAAARWMRPERRVSRAVRRGLTAVADAEIVTAEAGAGLCLETGAISVAWDKGRWRLDYRLDELMGAEILIDDAIAARVFRGEARLPLERIASEAESVGVRLLFDDPLHPDFELGLWPAATGERRRASIAASVREANTWLARVEAIVRRPIATAPVIRADRPSPPPVSDDEGDD